MKGTKMPVETVNPATPAKATETHWTLRRVKPSGTVHMLAVGAESPRFDTEEAALEAAQARLEGESEDLAILVYKAVALIQRGKTPVSVTALER